jgi:predicted dehydrogenase
MNRAATIGLIGCGRWGALVLRDLKSLGCRVIAVARSDDSRQRALTGGAEVVGSIDDLPAVDGIVVSTPSSTHADVVSSVLGRTVPIYVEKPLTVSRSDADRIAAEASGRVFVMDKWRYHAGILELGRIARSGELGSVVGLRTSRLGWGNSHDDVDSAWILAPHDLSIALEILGTVLPARTAMAEVADGQVVGLVGVCGTSPWHVFEVSARRRVIDRSVRLLCQHGIAELTESYADCVLVTRARIGRVSQAPEPERRPIATDMPLLLELAAFVEHLGGGPPPHSSAAEGAAIIRVLAELRTMAGLPA